MVKEIVLKNFWGEGSHLYLDELSWQRDEKDSCHSNNSADIFKAIVVRMGFNIGWYYLDDGNYYSIHREGFPIEVKRMYPEYPDVEYIGRRCLCDSHEEGELLYSFDNPNDLWDGIKINGKSLEEVLERSVFIYGPC